MQGIYITICSPHFKQENQEHTMKLVRLLKARPSQAIPFLWFLKDISVPRTQICSNQCVN